MFGLDIRMVKDLELITVIWGLGSHLEIKDRLIKDHIGRYSWEMVRGELMSVGG